MSIQLLPGATVGDASSAVKSALRRGWKGQREASKLLLAIASAASEQSPGPALSRSDKSLDVLSWSGQDLPAVRALFKAASNCSMSWTARPTQAPGELLAYPYAVLVSRFPTEPGLALDAAEYLGSVGRHEDALATVEGVYSRASSGTGPEAPARAAAIRMSALTALDAPEAGRAPVVAALSSSTLSAADRVMLLEELILHLMCVRPHLPPAADLALFAEWTLDTLPDMVSVSLPLQDVREDGLEACLDAVLFPVVSLALRCIEAEVEGLAGPLLSAYIRARVDHGGCPTQALDSLVKDLGPALVPRHHQSSEATRRAAVLAALDDPCHRTRDADGNELPGAARSLFASGDSSFDTESADCYDEDPDDLTSESSAHSLMSSASLLSSPLQMAEDEDDPLFESGLGPDGDDGHDHHHDHHRQGCPPWFRSQALFR